MTPYSLLQFGEALLWCAALFASIAGWGALALAAAGVRRPRPLIAAIAGFPVTLLLGGALNLAHGLSRPMLLAFVLLGLLAAALLLRPHQAEPTPSNLWRKTFLTLFVLVFATRLCAMPHWSGLQQSDDYNFYLAAPLKALELHHLAPDPFSERRVMSSVGGNYFLEDLVLAALPLENVQMADRALGLMLLALLALALGTECGLKPTQQALFALLVLIVPQLSFNLTFVLLPSALFLALVYLAAERDLFPRRPVLLALLLGGIAGAIATTKSTYLPHGVFFVLILAVFLARRKGLRAAVVTVLVAALGCLLVMLPWMIANHAASATWFYPSLGKGYQYSAYHLFPAPSSAGLSVLTHKVLPFCVPLFLVALAGLLLGDSDEQNDAIVALMLAALVAAILVGIGTGGDSVRRYNYPAILPAMLLLYLVAARRLNRLPKDFLARALYPASIALAVGLSLMIGLNGFTREYRQIPVGLSESLRPYALVPPPLAQEYAAMQAALPTDATAIATVNDMFLLDFRAHDIRIADVPGAASLPTGWPSRQSGDALAAYLLQHHIRYLIYSHADWDRTDPTIPAMLHDSEHYTQWVRAEHEITYLSHQQFNDLAGTRRQLFNDGRMYVLDLQTRR